MWRVVMPLCLMSLSLGHIFDTHSLEVCLCLYVGHEEVVWHQERDLST
jgi:hypothetical protein